MKTRILMLFAAATLAAGTAHAFEEKVWLLLGGGGSKYAMTDLNDELRYSNSAAGAGAAQFGMIEQGTSLSLAAGFELPNRLTFGLGTDRMFASTDASDASGSARYQFTAHAWRVFAEYPFHAPGRAGLRIGLGSGVIGESGKISFSIPGSVPPDPTILRGWAPMFEAYAAGDVWMTRRVGLSAAFGYRHAKLDVLHTPVDEFGQYYEFYSDIDGTPIEVDYSGAYVRLGFKVTGRGLEE